MMKNQQSPLKPLSKRALALLDDIKQANKVSATSKPNSLLGPLKQRYTQIKSSVALMSNKLAQESKKPQFKSNLYLTFTKSDKLPARLLVLLFMSLFFVVLCMYLFNLATLQNRLIGISNEIPQLQKQQLNVNSKIKKKQKERNELNQKIKQALSAFPRQSDINNYLDEVMTILEENRIKVVNQEINVAPLPPITKVTTIKGANPQAFKSTFAPVVVVANDDIKTNQKSKASKKSKPDKQKSADNNKADADASKTDAELLKQVNELKKISPQNFNYLLFKIHAEGNFIDYLRARSMLLDRFPQTTFPLEEIYANNKIAAIEYNILIEIPFIKEGH
ncbi:MAG: hypothetical protein NWS01_07100 [Burkholderiales bacterium]|nr:hypothetical protein [Burkholderiales bacterium]|tara:strand:+ start:834 stop:1838 length:1005 start_codon:yes stop_codon:yes gene_type:complete